MYRSGLLCDIQGTRYFHTGLTYTIRQGENGPELDLRSMIGFDAVEKEFSEYNALLHGPRWNDAAGADAALQDALRLVKDTAETLWWKAVVQFLTERHNDGLLKMRVRAALKNAGFSRDEIQHAFA